MPKWKWRSHRGIYLGLSKVQSSNIHLVLNPNTGHVSPQYHLVFDYNFSTVYSDSKFDADVWSSLVNSNLEQYVDAEDMVPTFKTETTSTLQLLSIPTILSVLSLPGLPTLPSFPELPTVPDLPPVSSIPDVIVSFCLPSLLEGVSSQEEGDPSPLEGSSYSPGGILIPNFADISINSILPSPAPN